MDDEDQFWMKQCFYLARKGTGYVSPNPMVGAVIVKDGKKISEGYHERYGSQHAEVNAIRHALVKKKDLSKSTIYVNLEPCLHYGKTPPCVDEILKYGFSKVVIATRDPNVLVAGKSIKKLRDNGVEVKIGVLRKQAENLNKTFFKYIHGKIPYVALKAAQTSDGFIAKIDGSSKWITNERSRMMVHRLRNDFDAVLVGANTVIQDDPLLTVRTVKGRNPVRVIIDGNLSVPVSSKVFNSDAKTIIYVSDRIAKIERKKIVLLNKKGVEVVPLNDRHGKLKIAQILQDLGARRIASILVEGGQRMYAEFLNARSIDKIFLFTSKKIFGLGIKTFDKISVPYKKRLIVNKLIHTDKYQEYSITFP